MDDDVTGGDAAPVLINEEAASFLDEVARRLRSGELTAVAVVALGPSGSADLFSEGDRPPELLLGAVHVAAHRFTAEVAAEQEEAERVAEDLSLATKATVPRPSAPPDQPAKPGPSRPDQPRPA